MCGIVYIDRRDGKSASKQTLKRYEAQQTRGLQGFGYVAFESPAKRIEAYTRFQYEREMRKSLEKVTASKILLHHRYPTSVINLPETAHPIKVSHSELQYEYYVAHNGWITNDEELKLEHEKLGYVYTTEVELEYKTKKGKPYMGRKEWNDSEALAIELARAIEGKKELVECTGPIAHITIQTLDRHPIAVYFGTNGQNPLTISHDGKNGSFLAIASEGGTPLKANQTFRLDLTTNEITEYNAVRLIEPIVKKYAHDSAASSITSRMGFDYTDISGDGSLVEPISEAGERWKMFYSEPELRSMSLDELEELLDRVKEYLIDNQAELDYAAANGEYEAEASWKEDIRALEVQYDKIERIYAAKAAQTA